MQQIEHFNLIDKIGRELQSQMTYDDIRSYLRGFDIDYFNTQSSFNSKRVFVK